MKISLIVLVAWLLALAPSAYAEEGLFIAKLSGGVSAAAEDTSNLGGHITGSMDLAIGERTGPVAGFSILLDQRQDAIGLHLGVKRILHERTWTRLYLSLAPEILCVWDHERDRGAELDLAAHGALGFEYLMMWGLGMVFELEGSVPTRLGEIEAYDPAWMGVTLGLFTEF